MKERIVNVPNLITLARFLLIPFFIWALVGNKNAIAVLLFSAIALGDALDGLSARIMKQKTSIGALFDSTTDWLVILSTLITFLAIKEYVSLNMIIVLIIPMIVVYIAKGIYVKKERKTIPTVIGKITVAFAYITTISILIDFEYKGIFLVLMVILAYATMAVYLAKDFKLFIKS